MNQDILVIIEHIRGQVTELSYSMLATGRILTHVTGGKLVALLLGYNQQDLADELAADVVWYTDHPTLLDFRPDAYLNVLAGQISTVAPRAVMIGHSSTGMDLSGALSVRLHLPLVSQCKNVLPNDGSLKFVCQICGGKLMAEGPLPEPTALLTMVAGDIAPSLGHSAVPPAVTQFSAADLEERRIQLLHYNEPDATDIDLSKESILIAVGRGLTNKDDLELIEELAEMMGGAVCGSRPIVDQGWLSTARLIGKSGKIVEPRLYLALGISGAPEHVEGFARSDTIVAINTDPSAPIFDVAHFGAEVDMLDLVEEMIDQLELVQVE